MVGLPSKRATNLDVSVRRDDALGPTECAQCGRDMGSSPPGDWCSETCMRRWQWARTRQPEAALSPDEHAASNRMVRRYNYHVATMGSWPEAWRGHPA